MAHCNGTLYIRFCATVRLDHAGCSLSPWWKFRQISWYEFGNWTSLLCAAQPSLGINCPKRQHPLLHLFQCQTLPKLSRIKSSQNVSSFADLALRFRRSDQNAPRSDRCRSDRWVLRFPVAEGKKIFSSLIKWRHFCAIFVMGRKATKGTGTIICESWSLDLPGP